MKKNPMKLIAYLIYHYTSTSTRYICRIPSLQDDWYPSSTFADVINKYYQLSGGAVITVKDLDDAIAHNILLQSEFSASKKQGNKSGIYQAKKAVEGRSMLTTLRLVK